MALPRTMAKDVLSGDPARLIKNPEDYQSPSPEEYIVVSPDDEPPHNSSLTAVATEALRTGLYPIARLSEIPKEDEKLKEGDEGWVDPLENEYVGDEVLGSDMPPPGVTVDDTLRIYGINESDSGALIAGEELWLRRDGRRWEAEEPED